MKCYFVLFYFISKWLRLSIILVRWNVGCLVIKKRKMPVIVLCAYTHFMKQLEIHLRSVERGICTIAIPQWTNCSYNYSRMHCACTKRPYFHFRSKIWRHHRISRSRFSLWRGNFGDSRTFKTVEWSIFRVGLKKVVLLSWVVFMHLFSGIIRLIYAPQLCWAKQVFFWCHLCVCVYVCLSAQKKLKNYVPEIDATLPVLREPRSD